jgi:hypothetical protein
VYVNDGTFIKQSGGIIYGSDAGSTLKNTATATGENSSSNGQAAYAYTSSAKRNTTAGTGVILNYSSGGTASGAWE